ncbi:MAG: NAD-dependent epimerase/dehydratase family protein [Chloroflexi bacterium]|nr:NAD-dependent epimerase/dehydratase family protein [Chloroflexota bacterium]
MRCVVTGGCGFIGSHIVDALVRDGCEVAVLDDLSTGNLEYLNPAAELLEGSVADGEVVRSAVEGATWVFHLAALPRVQQSVDDPVGTHAINVNGTLNVLQAAREHGVERVVVSSSSSVYGDQETHLMTEDLAPNPLSPYGLHKLIGEQYADLFASLFGMQIVSLRYFNVYGPRQSAEGAYALVIPHFLRLRDEGKPLTVYGDGCQTRDYVHVDDVVRANLNAANSELPVGRAVALNVGSGEETSVNEIAAMVGGEVEHIIPNPRGAFEELRKCADTSRAKSVISWEPGILLAEGIRSVL